MIWSDRYDQRLEINQFVISILIIWICRLKTNPTSIVDDIMRAYLSSVTLMNSPDLNVSSLSSAASKSYRALTCNKQFSLIGTILYWNTVYREIFASLYILSPLSPHLAVGEFITGWVFLLSFIINKNTIMFKQFEDWMKQFAGVMKKKSSVNNPVHSNPKPPFLY